MEKITKNARLKNPNCPLCKNTDCNDYFVDNRRNYFQCPKCCLIFIPPYQFLSADDEKAEYDLHENKSDDLGYRRFLSRLFLPMQDRISPDSVGLDFGSGPGPTLSLMFEEVGFRMEIFDKFYANDPLVLEQQYNFITATEVVEHLHDPEKTLDRLWKCLKIEGWIGIMTKLATGKEAFSKWHYKNDLTHVCFFSSDTFRWLANRWEAELLFVGKDVVLLKKVK